MNLDFIPSQKTNDLFHYTNFYGLGRSGKFSGPWDQILHNQTLEKAKSLNVSEEVWPYYELEDDFYFYNSYGYRTDEFETYEENNFDMILGCSHVEGIGLRKSEMWVSQYEKILNAKTVNLAKGGNSNNNMKNSLFSWFLSNRPKPRRIVVCWTEPTRYTYVRSSGSLIHYNIHWKIDDCFDEHDYLLNHVYAEKIKANLIWSNEFITDLTAVNVLANSLKIPIYNFLSSYVGWNVSSVDVIENLTSIRCHWLDVNLKEGWMPLPKGGTFNPAADGSHIGPQHQHLYSEPITNIIKNEENKDSI